MNFHDWISVILTIALCGNAIIYMYFCTKYDAEIARYRAQLVADKESRDLLYQEIREFNESRRLAEISKEQLQ